MANRWNFSVLLLFICANLYISNGSEVDSPQMANTPLLNYGEGLAGDDFIQQFTPAYEIGLDFGISYFGSSYDKIYISKDGLISFGQEVNYQSQVDWRQGARSETIDKPFLTPFYHEGYDPTATIGHTVYHGKIYYRLIYADKLQEQQGRDDVHYSEKRQTLKYFSQYVREAVIHPPKDFEAELIAVVTWSDVTETDHQDDTRCEGTTHDPCKQSTFQVVLVADKKNNTFAIFNYLKMDIPHNVKQQGGFNGGYGRGWVDVIPCHGTCHLDNNETKPANLMKEKGSDLQGRYILSVGEEEIVRGGCLPNNLKAGMLEVYPREVGMLGGERLEVSGKCLQATSQFYCKFEQEQGEAITTTGVMSNSMKGYCPVPILTTRGPMRVSWSQDGNVWSADKHITVEKPSNPAGNLNDRNMLAWVQHNTDTISVAWIPETISINEQARVEIKLVGYKEDKNGIEFKELETFQEVKNSDGQYTFQTYEHKCTDNCGEFEMGLLEVGLVKEFYGDATQRVALRFGPIPLGWYLHDELKERMGSDWSNQMCERWYEDDKQSTDWLKELPACPCSLDQALADFGRWQPGENCNKDQKQDKGKCYFHKDAKHCVRSITPTSDGAGNQCCYGQDGSLIYSQLSYYGSTPDRAHAWGAYPYNKPGRVPSFSHYKYDVLPYLYCCMWNDNAECDKYTRVRPTTDCSAYQVPGLGFVRGDPHITTFDGSTYTFGGRGDFWLLDLQGTSIQGRFMPRRGGWDLGRLSGSNSWTPNVVTSLTIQGSGQIIEIHPAPENAVRQRGMDIKVGRNRYFFYTDSTKWQHFGYDQSILNNARVMEGNRHDNFTIFTNNVGINVVALNNLLHVTVAVPPAMKLAESSDHMGMGLLGMFDGNPNNDYVSKSNTPLSPGSDAEKLFNNFGMSWAVANTDNMFPFPKDAVTMKAVYTPYFMYEDIPHSFSSSDGSPASPKDYSISATCKDNDNCKWDYRISGSQDIAKATKQADELFAYSQASATLLENCGFPALGEMPTLDQNNFSVGKEIKVTGCGAGHTAVSDSATFRCVMERVSTAEDNDRADYGRHVTDPNNGDKFLVHWVPKPFTFCEVNTDDASLYYYIGGGAGGLLLIIIIVVVVVCCCRRKKSRSHSPKSRRERDEDTEEPMMKDRNPVYKGGNSGRGGQRASSAV